MLTLSRRAALGATVIGSLARSALAQTATLWPTRPVRIVVPFGTGGSSDITALTCPGLGIHGL